jgi:hypothetical protein
VDSWDATQKLIAMIDNWGNIFLNDRLVDDTKKSRKL